MITVDQVQAYDKCENACNARNIFNWLAKSEFALSCSDFVSIRDHLIILCSFFTSNRSGVQSNMTMEEFRNVEVSPESIEIGVEKHKTADDYGNAGKIISHQVYKWLKLYLVARNQHVLKSDVVFVTWNGKSLTSGNISDLSCSNSLGSKRRGE